jgi:hypothetical protein
MHTAICVLESRLAEVMYTAMHVQMAREPEGVRLDYLMPGSISQWLYHHKACGGTAYCGGNCHVAAYLTSFDWRATFAVQAPAVLAVLVCGRLYCSKRSPKGDQDY